MATNITTDFLVRGMDPIMKQQLEAEAKQLGVSINQMAKILLEKELRHSLFKSELSEIILMQQSITHLTEAFHEFIELHTQLLHLMQGEDDSSYAENENYLK